MLMSLGLFIVVAGQFVGGVEFAVGREDDPFLIFGAGVTLYDDVAVIARSAADGEYIVGIETTSYDVDQAANMFNLPVLFIAICALPEYCYKIFADLAFGNG